MSGAPAATTSPRQVVVRRAARRRDVLTWVLLSGWAAMWGVLQSAHGGYSWHYFTLGSSLLTNWSAPLGGLHVYAGHPDLQIGPLALAAAAPFRIFGHASGFAAGVLMTVGGLAVLYALTGLAPPGSRAPTRFVGLAFLPVWSEVAVHYMHLDDALALALSVCALLAARGGRPVLTGVLLGAAVDSKPWAGAFAALILIFPGRLRVRAGIAFASAVLVAWLPFIVADPRTLALGRFTIVNVDASALNALGVHASRTPWWDRPAQLALGLVLAGVLVRRGRWSAILMAGIAIRLLLDPQTYPYYTSGLLVAAAAIDFSVGRRVGWWTGCTAAFYLLDAAGSHLWSTDVRGDLRAGVCAALILTLLLSVGSWPRSRARVHMIVTRARGHGGRHRGRGARSSGRPDDGSHYTPGAVRPARAGSETDGPQRS